MTRQNNNIPAASTNDSSTARNPRYVIADGQKVYLTREEQKEWDRMINHVRYRARRDKICGQPNYHRCCGDCGLCPYRVQGKSISTDSETFGGGFASGKYSPVQKVRTPEEIVMANESCRLIYAKAAEMYKNGDRILYMKLVEERSTYEIADALGMPQTTVNKYVNRLLAYIREHRDEFI